METSEAPKRPSDDLIIGAKAINTRRWKYLIFLALVLIAFFWGGSGIMHSFEIIKQMCAVQGDIDSLNAVIAFRQSQKDDLRPGGDALALETEARLNHNMIRPGEKMFVVEAGK